jgi:hypothetical protein
MRGKMSRAKKAMSIALPSGTGIGIGPGLGSTGSGVLGGVVVGTGGKDEAERREKRRNAADGVLYWQKEVARLMQEDHTGRR